MKTGVIWKLIILAAIIFTGFLIAYSTRYQVIGQIGGGATILINRWTGKAYILAPDGWHVAAPSRVAQRPLDFSGRAIPAD